MHSNYRGMAFLLSLGSLPIGCNKDDNETSGLGTLGPITTQSDDSSATAATDESGGTTTTGDDPTTNDVTTDDSGASASATNPSSATNQTTSPATGPQTGDPATSDADGTASDPQMTTFVTGNTDDTGFPESESGGSSPYCQGYGDKIAECFGRDPGMAAMYCQYYIDQGLMKDGPGCAQAFEAMFACLSQLDCDSFMMGTGCEQQESALMGACPSMGGP